MSTYSVRFFWEWCTSSNITHEFSHNKVKLDIFNAVLFLRQATKNMESGVGNFKAVFWNRANQR